MRRLGRFRSCHRKCVNKDAAANVKAEDENQEAERREDGSRSAYLNLDQNAEVIGCFFTLSSLDYTYQQTSTLFISLNFLIGSWQEVALDVRETTSEPSCRGKCGPNKMPKGRTLINELNELREPIDIVDLMGHTSQPVGDSEELHSYQVSGMECEG
jgi:hypothetical protein